MGPGPCPPAVAAGAASAPSADDGGGAEVVAAVAPPDRQPTTGAPAAAAICNIVLEAAKCAARAHTGTTLRDSLARARAYVDSLAVLAHPSPAELERLRAVIGEVDGFMSETETEAATAAAAAAGQSFSPPTDPSVATEAAVQIIERALSASSSLRCALGSPGVVELIWAIGFLGAGSRSDDGKLDALLGAVTPLRALPGATDDPPSRAMWGWPSIALLWVADAEDPEGASARTIL